MSRLFVVALLLHCKVNRDALENQAFSCSVTDPENTCGDGYRCYGAAGVGSGAFCVPECSELGVADEARVCTEDQELLERCGSEEECATSGLECMRTDLVNDRGLCLDLAPCTIDQECLDPARSTCLSSFLRQIYPDVPSTDNLYCVERCMEFPERDGVARFCASGRLCLRNVLPSFPNICAETCDSSGRCPPTMTCLQTALNNRVQLPLCVLGQPGFPCSNVTDCLGECVDFVPGLRVCAAACEVDEDCVPFDLDNGAEPVHFACYDGACVSPFTLFFNFCDSDGECAAGSTCLADLFPDQEIPICIESCSSSSECAPAHGMPRYCAPLGGGICVPSTTGAPCGDDSDCFSEHVCDELFAGELQCQIPCTSHSDCTGHRWAGPNYYCASETGLPWNACLGKQESLEPCSHDDQCLSGSCVADGVGVDRCE